MKKNYLTMVLATLLGVGLGYYRFILLNQHYDPLLMIIRPGAQTGMTLMLCISAVFILGLWFFCRHNNRDFGFDTTHFPATSYGLVLTSCILYLFVAYSTITTRGAGSYEAFFALTMIFALICSILVLRTKGDSRKLISVAPVLPMILSVLHIYKGNIKYPSIAHFAMELLATITLMLALYMASALFFRKTKVSTFVFMTACGLFFSAACIVYGIQMNVSQLLEPVIPYYFGIYFIATVLYLFSFFGIIMAKKQIVADKIKYYGWSAFTVESRETTLGIDSYFRKTAKVDYVTMEDFPRQDVIVLSHNHPEHCLDLPKFVQRDGSTLVAPQQFLDHNPNIGTETFEAKPLETLTVKGFEITTFPWLHRDIPPAITAEDEDVFDYDDKTICFGHIIRTPLDTVIVNLSECANPRLTKQALKELSEYAPQIDYLLLGYQLDFVESCGLCAKILNPDNIILFHPHEALFAALNVVTQPVDDFIKAIQKASPSSAIINATPGTLCN